MSEHLGISLKTNKKSKYNKSHAIAIRSHCFECQHSASFEDFKLISRHGIVVKGVEHILTIESRWFCLSGFEFAKTQLSILNH